MRAAASRFLLLESQPKPDPRESMRATRRDQLNQDINKLPPEPHCELFQRQVRLVPEDKSCRENPRP